VNLIATIGLLMTVFGGKDLGATANMITLANEQGVEEAHYIPNESYRRRMVVFFFKNVSNDPELDWLQYGVTDLLVQDLDQNPFISVSHPWENLGNGFYSRIKQAGFVDGIGIPRSLMAQISNDANRQYFVEGDVNKVADEYQVTARVWDSKSVQQVATFTETGWDLYPAIDRLTIDIRDAMEIPQSSVRIAEDIPLSDTYGESEQAFKDFISAINARLFENDMEASNAFLDSSVATDPGFVRSWFLKIINSFDAGDLPAAQAATQKSQELGYRLPANDRATIKAIGYRLSGQQDKLISFLQLQVRLRDDASSHNRLATMYMAMGKLEEAKNEFRIGLGKDSMNLGIFLNLANLEKGSGNIEGAIDYVRQYLDEKPDDADAQLRMGDLLRDNGDLTGAEEHYQQASMLENDPVGPTVKLALLKLRKGDEKAARALIEDAEAIAETAGSRAQVRNAAIYTEVRMGRLNAALEHLDRQEEILGEILPPFQVAVAVYLPRIQYLVELHNPEEAKLALAKVLTMLQPPMDQFLAFSEAAIAPEEKDFETVVDALARGEAIIDQFKLEDLRFQTNILEGYMQRLQGDHEGAAESFRLALERISRSVLVGSDADLFLPPLNANLAKSLISAGNLGEAAKVLDTGFAQDPSEPMLWASKALHQLASDMPQLAMASIDYALAIWNNADPEYREYRDAIELKAEIQAAL
jgi:tetratricopeptide (TPR) repeat protein/TolB-like protein